MDSSIFFGGSILAAVVAGALALFAPCCISFMLPAYFASSFQNRMRLVAMTFLFAGGVATVILPIALGASVLRQILTTQHATIYVVGGVLLFGLAIYLLLGGQVHLPIPGRRAGGNAGVASVYSLGVFSGITSSCCAPVLAGVIALSSVAPSFGIALGLGTAYVFGMVAPLFIISLLWERFDWRSSRLFHPRSFTWKLGRVRRTISATNLASGLLLLLMAVAMIWTGFTYGSMQALTGWQAALAVGLQHAGRVIMGTFAWVPNWAATIVLLLLVALLAWRALKQIGSNTADEESDANDGESVNDESMKEKISEY
jgi:cytochrome c-type biogenesis protein